MNLRFQPLSICWKIEEPGATQYCNWSAAKTQREGTHLILSGVHTQPLFALEKIGLVDQIGRENLCENLDSSIKRAKILQEIPAEEAFVSA